MRRHTIRRFMLPALLVPLLLAPRTARAQEAQPKQAGAAVSTAKLTPELLATKSALEKYADPFVALKDGYLSTVACIAFSKTTKDGPVTYPAGTMGVHLINMANVGPTLDPMKPQVLIYEPVDSTLKLVAAEWFMPAQLAEGKAPTIFGQTLAGPMDGHEPIMPASLKHYDLHVWLWKDNPAGMFTSTNAAVTCGNAPYAIDGSKQEHHHEM
jgi:hypothetical protein